MQALPALARAAIHPHQDLPKENPAAEQTATGSKSIQSMLPYCLLEIDEVGKDG